MRKIVVLIFVFLIIFISDINAGKYKFAAGLNYPGVGLKYRLGKSILTELKYQTTGDINVIGARGYYYFNFLKLSSDIKVFSGLEGDFIIFKGEDSKGNGFAAEVFAGGEYFFINNISFQTDIGPAFIGLKDRETKLSVSGVEIVLNMGVNYYW